VEREKGKGRGMKGKGRKPAGRRDANVSLLDIYQHCEFVTSLLWNWHFSKDAKL